MATKRYYFDFWHIERPEDAQPLDKLLKEAVKLTDLPDRIKLVSDHRLRYEKLEKIDDFWVGDITKFRDDTVPNKAGPKTPREPVPLATDERTTEDTAFGYHVPSNTLITQANHFGSSAGQIVRYIAELNRDDKAIYAEPILTQEGWERLKNLERITKIVYAIAPGKNFDPEAAAHLSVRKTLQLLSETGGRRVKVEIGVGHANTGLVARQIKSLATALSQMAGDNSRKVPKLEITGRDEDDVRDSFDLLEYRLRQPLDLEVAGRSATDEQRMRAVRQAYRQRATDVRDASLL